MSYENTATVLLFLKIEKGALFGHKSIFQILTAIFFFSIRISNFIKKKLTMNSRAFGEKPNSQVFGRALSSPSI